METTTLISISNTSYELKSITNWFECLNKSDHFGLATEAVELAHHVNEAGG